MKFNLKQLGLAAASCLLTLACSSSGGGGSAHSASSSANAGSTPDGSPSPAPSSSSTSSSSTGGSTSPAESPLPAGSNVMRLNVSGTACSGPVGTFNNPCVSITICQHGTQNCQTISNILLDTGSVGLRLFSSLVTVPTTPVAAPSGGNLAECITYGGGASQWGPLETVDVVLGGESAVESRVMLINKDYATPPALCSSSESVPDASSSAAFNGILGIDGQTIDCGTMCSTEANNGFYFNCNSANPAVCTSVATNDQVQNVISLLPQDNNGAVISLPSVAAGGVNSLSGVLYLGIGTQSNNTPASTVTAYPEDEEGYFLSEFPSFSTQQIASIIDTGTNHLIIPPLSGLTLCTDPEDQGAFCPTTQVSLSATALSATAAKQGTINFVVDNADHVGSSTVVSAALEIQEGGEVVWGLPFFYGHSVYIGIQGTTSSLGTGPYWAN